MAQIPPFGGMKPKIQPRAPGAARDIEDERTNKWRPSTFKFIPLITGRKPAPKAPTTPGADRDIEQERHASGVDLLAMLTEIGAQVQPVRRRLTFVYRDHLV